jgi:hypothetical protein
VLSSTVRTIVSPCLILLCSCRMHSDTGQILRLKRATYVYKHDSCRDVDKSLARPGTKQATATEDSDVHISYLLS